jgi:CheY-specific phosphatase CheX
MVPDLRANDFDGAVTVAVDELSQVIATDAKVTLDEDPIPMNSKPPSFLSGLDWFRKDHREPDR